MNRNLLRDTFRPSRVKLSGPDAYPLHDHDFAELGWVDEGTFTQRINGRKFEMKTGDFFFIRPGDSHSFHGNDDQPFYIVNICFQWHLYEGLKHRYFSGHSVYGENRKYPKLVHLTPGQLLWARKMFIALLKSPPTLFSIERFLMNLFAELCPLPERGFLDQAPTWMQQAWSLIQKQEHLRLGVPEFYRLCNRCPEHVSREFRRQTGQTIVQSISTLRLSHAAAMLAGTKHEIVDIAGECGFESLSHFYTCFRKAHHLTPREYRRRSQQQMHALEKPGGS
ncbi:MAG TPA: AraC family transcriptional regulator [Chthoniobacteraceae bacterium]|nr:AraC family transcriptional regulator [Chthoniobacteraceae bacterium]